jgi:hypothetical protein
MILIACRAALFNASGFRISCVGFGITLSETRYAGIGKQFVGGFAVLTKKFYYLVHPDWRKFEMPMTLQRARRQLYGITDIAASECFSENGMEVSWIQFLSQDRRHAQ